MFLESVADLLSNRDNSVASPPQHEAMGESEDQAGTPDTRPAEPEPVTAEDEFYHQAVILDQCFNKTGMSPRMQEVLARMRWERTAAEAKGAHRQPRRSA
jgi:hypothetical protein